jgi:hypothetical protein
MKNIFLLFSILILVFSSCEKEDDQANKAIIIAGSGIISDEVDDFRILLGDPLNNTTGVTGGRREISWDGLPDDLVGQPLPLRLFNPLGPNAPVSMQRGLAYIAGGQFKISNENFKEVNADGITELIPFSGNKLFANVSENDWEIEFEVPGQQVGASVLGFGAVFTDVDVENSVSLEFFNQDKSLGKYYVPKRQGENPHSFLGVYFHKGDAITRIAVSHPAKLIDGNKDISNGGPDDLVALDDFFYDEPIVR